jgi:TRAP transporter TAXI family solute receptor
VNLRSLAVLYVNTVQLVARADSGIRSVRDLRGARIGVGAPGSGTEVAARIIIEAHGLSYRDVRADYLSFAEVAAQLQDRTLEAGVLVASFPVAALTDAATTIGVRLLPVEADAVARIQADYPFFKPVTIPRGTYRGLDADLQTVGVDNLLVCSAALAEPLAFEATRLLFESLADLAHTHAAARKIDIAQARSSPLPLHPGAERYYRQRGILP